jgi:hypothetical protein
VCSVLGMQTTSPLISSPRGIDAVYYMVKDLARARKICWVGRDSFLAVSNERHTFYMGVAATEKAIARRSSLAWRKAKKLSRTIETKSF